MTASSRFPSTASVVKARMRCSSTSGFRRTVKPTIVPSEASLAMRFCTVPRATWSVLASEATEARASLRRRAISCRSRSSIDQNVTNICLFDQYYSRSGHFSGLILVLPRPTMGTEKLCWRAAMVDFIGIERIRELVARRGAARFIEELAAEIESDFLRWGAFEKSPRHATHSPGGVIELMPASDGRLYAFKYVNGHPRNTAVGLLTVTAFGVLADVETGYPLLLSELTLTTALRTAATSALAARHMARPDSRTLALIGNGAQSEFQIIAFHHLLGIREVRLFDVDPRATDKLQRNLATLNLPQLKVVRCASTAEAVDGVDIVTTV